VFSRSGGAPGSGDNITIEETNLLTFLGASTVAEAWEILHSRLIFQNHI
jgi:hypothetical protein